MSLQAEVAKSLKYIDHCREKMETALEKGLHDDAMFFARGAENEFHRIAELIQRGSGQ